MGNEIVKVDSSIVAGYETKEGFDLLQRTGIMFAASSLVPKEYQSNVPNCTIACNMAQRMKADPFMVMQNLAIIHGRPSLSSKFLISSVNSSGRFEPLRYRFEKGKNLAGLEYTEYVWKNKLKVPVIKVFNEDINNTSCVAYTKRIGSNDLLESSVIDIKMAIKEGWYTKSGSKWQTMPEQMLRYRSASFWTNVYAPEISMGMVTADEAQDIREVESQEPISVETQLEEEIAEKANTVILETGETVNKNSGEVVEEKPNDDDMSGQKSLLDDTPDYMK